MSYVHKNDHGRQAKMVITVNKNDDHGIFGVIGYRLFTVTADQMKCYYRPCGASEMCLPLLRD